MYKITLTCLRYGDLSSEENYYAKDDNQLNEIKNYLFERHDINNAFEVDYSIGNNTCSPTDNWNEVYWTFDEDEEPKWGYTLKIEPIKFGV